MSILSDVREGLGFEDTYFDNQIAFCIDTAFEELKVIGVEVLREGADYNVYQWLSLIADNRVLNLVRNYVTLFAKMQIDPPQNSKQIEYLENTMKRTRSRIKDIIECDK